MTPRRNTTSWELDLHGYTWSEARTRFVDFYNQALSSGKGRIELTIIHGWGASGQGGTLRSRLRHFPLRLSEIALNSHPERMSTATAATPTSPLLNTSPTPTTPSPRPSGTTANATPCNEQGGRQVPPPRRPSGHGCRSPPQKTGPPHRDPQWQNTNVGIPIGCLGTTSVCSPHLAG